ncbi:MAG: AzlD domain-containing protein [Actinomycetes bacterium]
MTWTAILVTSAGCYLLKLVGLSLPQSWLARPGVQRVTRLLPVALLAALAAVQTFTDGADLVVDARLVGVAAGITVLLLRAPFVVVVGVAAATAALVRAVT